MRPIRILCALALVGGLASCGGDVPPTGVSFDLVARAGVSKGRLRIALAPGTFVYHQGRGSNLAAGLVAYGYFGWPVLLIGAPLRKDGRLYNCAIAIADGRVAGADGLRKLLAVCVCAGQPAEIAAVADRHAGHEERHRVLRRARIGGAACGQHHGRDQKGELHLGFHRGSLHSWADAQVTACARGSK